MMAIVTRHKCLMPALPRRCSWSSRLSKLASPGPHAPHTSSVLALLIVWMSFHGRVSSSFPGANAAILAWREIMGFISFRSGALHLPGKLLYGAKRLPV